MAELQFYQKTWFALLMLVLFAPVGIFLLWYYKKFNKTPRIVLSIIFTIVFITAAFGQNETSSKTNSDIPSKTTQGQNQSAFNTTETEEPSVPASTQTVQSNNATPVSGLLKVHFLDVGQADSILIQAPNGKSVLIDGGNSGDGQMVVDYLKAQGVRELAAVIATHPHEDHIGGLDTIINNFPVSEVYMPNKAHTSQTFEDFIAAVTYSKAKKIQAKAGVKLNVAGLDGVFLAPHGSSYSDLNSYSAVLLLTYGETKFLFEGDAETDSEFEMLASSSIKPDADLLKVGHHGSSYSTSDGFLQAVSPKYAVISVGQGNGYGHPTNETLNKLAAAKVQVFRTDLMGTIVATSDGQTIKLDKKASAIKPNAPPSSSNNSGSGTIVVPPPSGSKNITVYITRTGEKYHRSACRYLSRSKISISLKDAKAQGYTACSVCDPPQ